MNLTSKSRYAFKIMIDLAVRSAGTQAERGVVVARHGIPASYMDQILLRLRNAELVVSARGRKGGYRLARRPDEISVLDIVVAVEDALEPVQCLVASELCVHQETCVSKDAWHHVYEAMKTSLKGLTLKALAAVEGKDLPQPKPSPDSVIECRPGPSRSYALVGKSAVGASQSRSNRRSLV
jgi:Rrf2 family iron-sulfur cluster assembly transcriptional regulator